MPSGHRFPFEFEEIDVRLRGDVVVLDLPRSFGALGADALLSLLDQLLGRGFPKFVLNVRCVRQVDGVAMGELLRAHLRVNKNGGRVHVTGLPKAVLQLLETPGFAAPRAALHIFTAEDEAVEAFGLVG